MPYSYENYDVKSKTYTGLRRAIGVEKELGHFEKNQATPLNEQHVLDVGCGTGNYMLHFVDKVKQIRCMDYNDGMLEQAKKNLENKKEMQDRVTFAQGDMCNLKEYQDESFDAACCNQVVHHLRPDDDYADLRKAACEVFRVLKTNGRFVINWSPANHEKVGMWWAELIPNALEQWMPRAASMEKMEEILKAAGFEEVRCEPLYDEVLYDPELYFDPKNFLKPEFRLSDSTFNLVSEEEMQRATARVEKMIADGTLDEWFKKKEADRKAIGQTVNVYAVKKSSWSKHGA